MLYICKTFLSQLILYFCSTFLQEALALGFIETVSHKTNLSFDTQSVKLVILIKSDVYTIEWILINYDYYYGSRFNYFLVYCAIDV